ncbi:ThiF family adenylyltransferase [Tenacibaculum sp. SG-28]|uniref:HesA/MoeB/ThiF family protein n=1 Tax=Tenacibaculum sp. SG-28 TaxID=754426 RepID=UPI0026BDA4EB
MNLSTRERKHYDRHLILDKIGEKGQLKLKQAKVLVIGAGGLGCPVLQYLTAAGVGTIGIIDPDVVDQSNLQRQILYTIDDIGASKAVTASKRLSKLNPFVQFTVYQEKLTTKNAISLFEIYDIIVDGSDNFETRYLTNDAAILTDKPLVYGAIFKFEGQVSVFNYNGSATYRCLYPTPPKPETSPNCSEIGVLGVLPGIIGSFQANEVIKIICNIGEVLANKLLIYDTLSMRQVLLKYEKSDAYTVTSLDKDYAFFVGYRLP